MRAMVIGLWVMTTKRVSVWPRHLVEQVAVALDIGVVERRVHLVEHADRRRVGQEHREDQRGRGQRLLAAGQQGHASAASCPAGGRDLEAGFQRIVRIDQLQFGRAAAEQGREQLLEMLVDHVEGGEQALAALAVQAADRLPQALDRLDEIVALGGDAVVLAPRARSAPRRRAG